MQDSQELLRSAVALRNAGRWNEAEERFRAALAATPTDAQARYLFGRLLFDTGRFGEAATALRQATALRANYVEAWRDLGRAEMKAGRIDRALKALEKAASLAPDDTDTLFALGETYNRANDAERTAAVLEEILRIRPDCEEALINLASLQFHRHEYDAAVRYFRRLHELRPNDEAFLNSLIRALIVLERDEEAIEAYRAATRRAPEDARLHLLLGQTLLRTGNFREGWAEFQWWLKTTEHCAPPPPGPEWTGEPIAGSRLLVVPDKGFGDTFQFLRFLAPLREQTGATIVLQCAAAIERLAPFTPGVDEIWAANREGSVALYERWVGLTSLPYLLGIELENLPASCPYLFAPPEIIASWRERLSGYDGLRVGLRWSGNRSFMAFRSCQINDMAALREVDGVAFFSLQENADERLSDALRGEFPIVELAPFLTDFAETAGAISNLDLVITIDTSIAHLAGALGKPTWTALPWFADWRWMERRTDCPWYPTMRLFRQANDGDYADVFARMAEALRQFPNP